MQPTNSQPADVAQLVTPAMKAGESLTVPVRITQPEDYGPPRVSRPNKAYQPSATEYRHYPPTGAALGQAWSEGYNKRRSTAFARQTLGLCGMTVVAVESPVGDPTRTVVPVHTANTLHVREDGAFALVTATPFVTRTGEFGCGTMLVPLKLTRDGRLRSAEVGWRRNFGDPQRRGVDGSLDMKHESGWLAAALMVWEQVFAYAVAVSDPSTMMSAAQMGQPKLPTLLSVVPPRNQPTGIVGQAGGADGDDNIELYPLGEAEAADPKTVVLDQTGYQDGLFYTVGGQYRLTNRPLPWYGGWVVKVEKGRARSAAPRVDIDVRVG
jgi:hypothetical protein